MESSRNSCRLVNFGLDPTYLRGCQASASVGVTTCCSPCHDWLPCFMPLSGTYPHQDHMTLPRCQDLLQTYLPSLAFALLSLSIVLSTDPQACLTMVSSVEDDGSWQIAQSTERDTEMIMRITTTKTTHEGTTETKVKTVVKCSHVTRTTLRSPRKCSPSATITGSTTTPPSASSTPQSTPKSQSGSAFPPSVPHVSTSHSSVIPHPSDVPQPTSPPEGFYLIIVGQEVGIFYTWKDAALRVLDISGAVHYKCKTFQ